jgi:Porin subfamily
MKLVKSLLLGSAAGLMAVAGAQAADLPSRKAAPADYVRICSAYGSGFFFIPGTETCLRVSGRVRAEYLVGERVFNTEDSFGFRARGRMTLDARTQTGYGTLRTFARFEMTSNSGQYNSTVDTYATGFNLAYAFIQFAGLTAGKADSFFDFYKADLNWGGLRGSQGDPFNVLAYTASFGGGFSATLSLEDGASRKNNVANGAIGREYPDLVASLRVDQAWGSAQLMGALHQVRGTAGGAILAGYNKTGYAIGAGLKINLPTLAAGDYLFLEGIYANGALNYIGASGSTLGVSSFGSTPSGDSYANPVTGRANLASGFSLVAGLLHYWTPQVRQGIYASYLSIDQGSSLFTNRSDITEYRIGSNLIWSPVSGLDIGVEILYSNITASARGLGGVVGTARLKDDTWAARLRIQRDF